MKTSSEASKLGISDTQMKVLCIWNL